MLFLSVSSGLQAEESAQDESVEVSEASGEDVSVSSESSEDGWEEIDAKIAAEETSASESSAPAETEAEETEKKASTEADDHEKFRMPADASPLMRTLMVDEEQIDEDHVKAKHQRLIDSWQDSHEKRYDSYFGAAGN